MRKARRIAIAGVAIEGVKAGTDANVTDADVAGF
jgi:hypothetical protein